MNLRALSLALLTLAINAGSAAFAGDFPGKGRYNDWSAALPYYNQANRYLNQGLYQDAVTKYQMAIMRYQYDPDFYTNLGVAFRKSEQYDAAEDALKRATQLSPNDWMPWSDLANVYLKQNKLKDTMATFQRALKCNPPAGERLAIMKDIADIRKIMRMQGIETGANPGAGKAADKAAAKATDKAVSTSSKAARGTAQRRSQQQSASKVHNTVTLRSEQAPTTSADESRRKEMLEKSGWDYISK